MNKQQKFIKLDVEGNPLPDFALSWSMVKDNVTGLIWEMKTDDTSIHDKDNTYNWFDAQSGFIVNLNAAGFGGFSDWRLPTVKELSFIVNRETYNPAINPTYFPNTMSSHYWSSTTNVDSKDRSWCINFYNGDIYGYYSKLNNYHVRAVRGGQAVSLDNPVERK